MGRMPSRMNVARRGINIQCNLCLLCMKEEETIQHLFTYCEVSQRVWDKCDRWVKLTTVRNNDIINHFRKFYAIGLSKKANIVWKGMSLAIVWEIWKHRNKIVFRNGIVDDVEIFAMAQVSTLQWTKTGRQKVHYSFSDWCLNPRECLVQLR